MAEDCSAPSPKAAHLPRKNRNIAAKAINAEAAGTNAMAKRGWTTQAPKATKPSNKAPGGNHIAGFRTAGQAIHNAAITIAKRASPIGATLPIEPDAWLESPQNVLINAAITANNSVRNRTNPRIGSRGWDTVDFTP
jgi:hypothetical protein